MRSLAADPGCDGFTLCAVEESAERAIIAAIALEPDVFLLVSDLPSSPLAVAAWVARAAPGVKIIVVVENVDEEECLAFLMAGASAYHADDGDRATLASVVRGVAAGLAIVPPSAQRRLLEELRG